MSIDDNKYDFERFEKRKAPQTDAFSKSRIEKLKKERKAAIIRLIIRAIALVLAVVAVIVAVKACKKPKSAEEPVQKANLTSSQEATQTEEKVEVPKTVPLPKIEAEAVSGEIESSFVAVLDCEQNKIIAGRAVSERMYPASTTKIMTALLVCERAESLDDTFTMTTEIIDPLYRSEATLAGFTNGENVTVRDLVYGTILPSGADAATAAALYTAGSEEAFVQLMNKKVEELGLKNTHFSNMTGLYAADNYSTAYDMAVILRAALENEFCKQVLSTYQYTTAKTPQHPEGIPLTSTLFSYMYGTEPEGATILGGKTGFVNESGYVIATYGQAESGKTYICVTAKAPSRWPAVFDQINLYTKYAE